MKLVLQIDYDSCRISFQVLLIWSEPCNSLCVQSIRRKALMQDRNNCSRIRPSGNVATNVAKRISHNCEFSRHVVLRRKTVVLKWEKLWSSNGACEGTTWFPYAHAHQVPKSAEGLQWYQMFEILPARARDTPNSQPNTISLHEESGCRSV